MNSSHQKIESKAALRSGLFILAMIAVMITVMVSAIVSSTASSLSAEPEPTLTIQVADQTRTFTRSQLLAMKPLEDFVVEKDPAYPAQKITYRAIPLALLFDGIKLENSNTLLFKCLDGFSAPISVARVLNRESKAAHAFLAIEPPGAPWPKMKTGKSAGPFYIVWTNPEASNVGSEEWPFQISGFEVKPSIEQQFPNVAPDPKLSENDPVRRGYLAFQKTCFACHTLNGEGASHLGPDLNVPMNPTEYFKPGRIEILVRNPQNLRRWPEAKMPALGRETISDRELENIVAYLKHMSHRKKKIEN